MTLERKGSTKARRARLRIDIKRYELSDCYFPEMRKRNYIKYRYMALFGYAAYVDETARLRQVLAEIYYDLSERSKMSEFYRFGLRDEFSSAISFINALNTTPFYISEVNMPIKSFRRAKKIERLYKEYCEKVR